MREPYWIGIDIGGTHIRIGAVTDEMKAVAYEKLRTADVFLSQDSGTSLVRMIKQFLQRHGLAERIRGISIGFPATLNRERTRVLQAPAVPCLNGLCASALLEDVFGAPACLERDVLTTLYYDKAKYGIHDCEILLGIYVGTGIGNAILIDGKELVGRNGAAGELGHIPAMGNDVLCSCGNHGCVEMLAGGKYLAKLCGEHFDSLPVGQLFSKHSGHILMKEYLCRLAQVIATEINIFDPDCLILGGGVLAMQDFPVDELVEKIHAHTRKPFPGNGVRMIITDDDAEKGVIGAVLYAREKWGEVGCSASLE